MSLAKTLVIFDIDGTLLFSNSLDSRCFGRGYENVFGKAFPSLDWNHFDHVTDHTIFNSAYESQFGESCSSELRQQFEEHYINLMKQERELYPHEFCEVPGAKSIIDRLLNDDQYEVGIATGGWKNPALFKLDHVNIDHTAIHDSYADNKSTRNEIIQESIDQAKENRHIAKIVYVGDAEWDVKTTNEMNIPLIGIRRAGDHDKLLNLGVKKVLSDYLDQDQFIDIVNQL